MYFEIKIKSLKFFSARQIFYLIVLLPTVVLAQDNSAFSALHTKLDSILNSAGNAKISFKLVDLDNSKTIYAKNTDQLFKPASVMKILTSVTALEVFGPEYMFKTLFLILKGSNGVKLYVQGLGDPSLTTEFLWIAARKIKKLGITKIKQIVIDETAFIDPPTRQGQRSYMTGSSALAFNFNSIMIDVCPGTVGQPGLVTTDPWEMPVKIVNMVKSVSKGSTSISVEETRSSTKNHMHQYAVKGLINIKGTCKTINRSIENPGTYFAYVLEGFLKYLGISTEDGFVDGKFPQGQPANFEQTTFPLSYVIKGLNHYSTNFIAEQLLYQLGGYDNGRKFDRLIGIEKISSFLEGFGFKKNDFVILDGSGLSHDNRISTNILIKLLTYAYQNKELRNEFIASLPVAGKTGTVKKRKFDTNNVVIRAKTGSIDGVSSLAGYIFTSTGKNLAFAILQNNISSVEKAHQTEERLVDIAAAHYKHLQ